MYRLAVPSQIQVGPANGPGSTRATGSPWLLAPVAHPALSYAVTRALWILSKTVLRF